MFEVEIAQAEKVENLYRTIVQAKGILQKADAALTETRNIEAERSKLASEYTDLKARLKQATDELVKANEGIKRAKQEHDRQVLNLRNEYDGLTRDLKAKYAKDEKIAQDAQRAAADKRRAEINKLNDELKAENDRLAQVRQLLADTRSRVNALEA